MPLKQKVRGSHKVGRRKPINSLLPTHGYNTEEGYLPATEEQTEKLEKLALSRWVTEEHRSIIRTTLGAINLTRARARETILNCMSDWELFYIHIEKAENGDKSK